MPLPSGQSEIDSMVIRLPRLGIDLDNWSRYNYSQRFGKGVLVATACCGAVGLALTIAARDE